MNKNFEYNYHQTIYRIGKVLDRLEKQLITNENALSEIKKIHDKHEIKIKFHLENK